jgi:ADP-dependent NAD(P)H-hydrate dehydratase
MPKSRQNKSDSVRVTRDLLEQSPIPSASSDDDKDERGRVLVVGGEVSLPGAVVLAGIAALRAGAGKLQIATCRSIAPLVGVSVPESLSLGLAETADGIIAAGSFSSLAPLVDATDALLVGPGMKGEDEEKRFVRNVLSISTRVRIILDAGALYALEDDPTLLHGFRENAIVTPHAKEMARILGIDVREVARNPERMASEASVNLNSIVALKGAETFIATPGGEMFCYDSGDVGLATSGSGDTLAGVVAGLVARGASPRDATLWAVFLHGSAGNRLAKRIGRVGYLARELLDEIPIVMRRA